MASPHLLAVDGPVGAEGAVLDEAELVDHLRATPTCVHHLTSSLHICIVPTLCFSHAGERCGGNCGEDGVVHSGFARHGHSKHLDVHLFSIVLVVVVVADISTTLEGIATTLPGGSQPL